MPRDALATAKRAQAAGLRAQADALDAEADALDATTPGPADTLAAFPFGFEVRAARGLIDRGELRAVRIGRRLFASAAEVAGLASKLKPVAPRAAAPANDGDSYAAVVASVGGGRR